MLVLPTLWQTLLLVVLINLPFGFWRAGCRKLSVAWFIAIHAPVILTIGLRLGLGIPFRWLALPLFVLAFIGGQFLGARIRRQLRNHP